MLVIIAINYKFKQINTIPLHLNPSFYADTKDLIKACIPKVKKTDDVLMIEVL